MLGCTLTHPASIYRRSGHIDNAGDRIRPVHPTRALWIKVFIYLNDIGADGGCTALVPGSHRWSLSPEAGGSTFPVSEGGDPAELLARMMQGGGGGGAAGAGCAQQ